jgi:SM-20-related protein
MPPAEFFRNLGLFVRSDFFDQPACAEMQARMCAAEFSKALVIKKDVGEVLDESRRRVLTVEVEECLANQVWDQIWHLKPNLEDHFHTPLQGGERPVFLRYGEQAFYHPHRDGSPDVSTRNRRVSVVIFLNARSEEPTPGCYGGGALTFYGLLDGPEWEKCAFSLEAEPGLLIAFRSDTLHEVQPVTFGQRFTIVTWFVC